MSTTETKTNDVFDTENLDAQGDADQMPADAVRDAGNEAAPEEPDQGQKASKNRRRVILALLIIILLLCLAYCSWRDPNARKGHYEGKTPEQIQHDLDTEVGVDSMEISVASVFELRSGETTVDARIENVEANHCDQRVKIYPIDDPDDVLFTSGALAPGEYLQEIELAHTFEPGSYQLLVEFQGYESTPALVSDEGRILGHDRFGASCAAQVTLNVTVD
jgi:hypothetical protein